MNSWSVRAMAAGSSSQGRCPAPSSSMRRPVTSSAKRLPTATEPNGSRDPQASRTGFSILLTSFSPSAHRGLAPVSVSAFPSSPIQLSVQPGTSTEATIKSTNATPKRSTTSRDSPSLPSKRAAPSRPPGPFASIRRPRAGFPISRSGRGPVEREPARPEAAHRVPDDGRRFDAQAIEHAIKEIDRVTAEVDPLESDTIAQPAAWPIGDDRTDAIELREERRERRAEGTAAMDEHDRDAGGRAGLHHADPQWLRDA